MESSNTDDDLFPGLFAPFQDIPVAGKALPIENMCRVDLAVGEKMGAMLAYQSILFLGSYSSTSKINKDFHSRNLPQFP